MNTMNKQFTTPLLLWFNQHGRKHLPWKVPVEPYRIWLSEIMLQQTQVVTVIPYYLEFIERFPSIADLANAHEDEVLSLWSGLGYYSRGRNLHHTARIISNEYHGIFPNNLEQLKQLPGIGPSTAAAILSQAFNLPTPILDGNVKRVLSRYFMVEGFSTKTTQQLWELAHHCMSQSHPADYTQAIMDLGATCCTNKKPQCQACPLNLTCSAHLHNVVLEYPHKKPKKAQPIKQQQFLLMHNDNHEIYLEKRPSKGIWGGLWSTPSIETDIDPRTFIETTYEQTVLDIRPFMQIKHTFTHFRLYIDALTVKIESPASLPSTPSGHWFSHSETNKLGLPKPISDMIDQFYDIPRTSHDRSEKEGL